GRGRGAGAHSLPARPRRGRRAAGRLHTPGERDANFSDLRSGRLPRRETDADGRGQRRDRAARRRAASAVDRIGTVRLVEGRRLEGPAVPKAGGLPAHGEEDERSPERTGDPGRWADLADDRAP